jgi:adenine-specific DNA-methyltransferase
MLVLTELREMLDSSINEIKDLGNKIILSNDYSMENVNQIVNSFDLKYF